MPISVFIGFLKKIGGHFDPLGLVSGCNFQILGVISYIMYIVVTSLIYIKMLLFHPEALIFHSFKSLGPIDGEKKDLSRMSI